MAFKVVYSICNLLSLLTVAWCSQKKTGLQLMTVATDPTDGFSRMIKSAKHYGLDVQVLGMGQKWEGGDVIKFPGGGQKILLLKDAMEKIKDETDLVVMFTDSYDVILTGKSDEILKRFKKFGAKVVFSTEDTCWPEESLADHYPAVKPSEKRFLNSGGFIGYAPQIYEMVTQGTVKKDDDDQLYYTGLFLDKTRREKMSIKLDTRGEIFQNLNGALAEVQLKFKGNQSFLYNTKTGNSPIVIHGNGPIKHHLNQLGNYLVDGWTPSSGCQNCDDSTIKVKGINPDDLPTVYMAIFLEHPMPFMEDFFNNIGVLNYPKNKITLFIHYADDYHKEFVENFMDRYGLHYSSVQMYSTKQGLNEWTARNKALEGCLEHSCQYFFAMDGEAQLENADVLMELIQRNRSAIAPMLIRPEKMWSNFWGSLSPEGFYRRSDDYVDIIQNNRRGVWNVPYIVNAFLIHGYHIPKLIGAFADEDMDADMAICKKMRELGIFMFVDNLDYFGHLVDSDEFDITHKHNDMYQLFDNKYTWEQKYLHEDYHKYLSPKMPHEEPCTDVFWQPLISPTFCRHLIEEMENFGQWSGGKNTDERLAGGYENVPTVDIHTNQIGWEKHWLKILEDYVSPIVEKLYGGYFPESRAVMNFVVRYKPTEQDRLRPHSDSSTFTVNMALNRPEIDYQGGGVRFLRYNCTVTDLRMGWFLLHPGRLTHHHEGLQTTGGTRYIMVSFVDP